MITDELKYTGLVDWGKPNSHVIECIEKLIAKRTLKKVLDLGCGSGRYVQYFAHQGVDVVALDINKEALLQLEKKIEEQDIRKKVKIIHIDCRNYQPISKFDLIFCSGLFEMFPIREKEDLCNRIKKWTAKNGYNLIRTLIEDRRATVFNHLVYTSYDWLIERYSKDGNWSIIKIDEPILKYDKHEIIPAGPVTLHIHVVGQLIAQRKR